MSADTLVAGYPKHRVETYRYWINQHGAPFTSWSAACGMSGGTSGHGRLHRAGQARRGELCPACFPGGDHRGVFPPPREVEAA